MIRRIISLSLLALTPLSAQANRPFSMPPIARSATAMTVWAALAPH